MNKQKTTRPMHSRGFSPPKPRAADDPPAGEYTYNGAAGNDFIQGRRWLWQLLAGRWVVIG
jgi:hypothetical protein